MLSPNSPVTNLQFADMPGHLGIRIGDWLWLSGLNQGHWGKIQADARHPATAGKALATPFLAILARWMHLNPDGSPGLRAPAPAEFLARLQAALGGDLSQARFAILIGLDKSAAYRWVRKGARPPGGPSHALSLIDDPDPVVLAGNWRRWEGLALVEARARGIPDLLRHRGWRPAQRAQAQGMPSRRRRRTSWVEAAAPAFIPQAALPP